MPGSEPRLPRWSLASVYGGFDAPAYRKDKERAAALAAELNDWLSAAGGVGPGAFAPWLTGAIDRINEVESLLENLGSYCYAVYSTDTRNERATKELNVVEELDLPVKRAAVSFRNILASRKTEVDELLGTDPAVGRYRFFIGEELFWQGKQMAPELEDLAEDLGRSGGEAWSRLQDSVSSLTSVVWDEATGEKKTVIQLRNLAFDPDRAVRAKAFAKELEAWKSVEVPLAAALNGVKGTMVTLNRRRGWKTALDKSIAQSRISRASLDALLAAMRESLPVFRSYLKTKARLLGVDRCAFYDLFAPVGSSCRSFTWEEAREIVIGKYGAFSPEMGEFARRAFENSWIDAEPREGKVGGAYCTDFPLTGESRVLANFEGSYSSVITLAHELGHAWHHEVIKDLPKVLADYPMTLAETASIFGETIVFESILAGLPESERLGPLEMHLQDPAQVIVDILSRFIFEEKICARREEGELSPDEFSGLMLDAEREAYGDGLDPAALHPYMWAVKSHYYRPGLAFYNYPYAFGQLLALGLYARYREEGPSFAATYRSILRETGMKSAVEVTKAAGFDIETTAFWKSGLDVIAGQVGEFERLAAKELKKQLASGERPRDRVREV